MFAAATPDQRIGEASSAYLLSQTAAARIADVRPDARIIAILREPASFLRSLHLQLLRTHVESKQDFGKAIALEPARSEGRKIPRRLHRPQLLLYSNHVRYVEQLRRYHAAFGPEQVLVLIYDDFRADNEGTVRTVRRFLGVEQDAPVQAIDANTTSTRMRSQPLDELLNIVSVGRGPVSRALKASLKTVMPSELRSRAIRATQRHLVNATPRPPDEGLMLELRRRYKGEVVALSVGPPVADVTLRKALMMGADRMVRLWDERLRGCDSFGMALVLAEAALAIGFDLLLCGTRSVDTGGELMAAAIAEHLGLPLIARAVALRLDGATGRIVADKKLERGVRETYAARLPAVLSIERGPAEPRYCGPLWVRRLMRAKVDLLTLKDIGLTLPLPAPRVTPLGLSAPKPRTKIGVKVSGLSLKDKLAIMRGRTSTAKKEEVVEERPEDAARKIKEHLDKWLG